MRIERRWIDSMQAKELLVSTEYGIDFFLMDDGKSIYLEFTPGCKICNKNLKNREFEKQYQDLDKDSPAYMSVIERDYLCPDCKVHTSYKIMDFSLALKELVGPLKERGIPTINIIKDPFLEPPK
jgi:hypothetical protein